MRYCKTFLILFPLLFMVCLTFTAVALTAGDYFIPTDVIDGGGKEGTSASYKLCDSAGQPAIGDLSTSASFKHFTGFWYAVSESLSLPPDSIPDHFQFTAFTGWSYAILIDSAGLQPPRGSTDLKRGDEVGVFDGTLCVGATVYLDEFPMALTAWKNDSYTDPDTDGYISGNPMSFKIWLIDSSEEYSAYAAGYSSGDGNFDTPPYARITYLYTSTPEVESDPVLGPFSLGQNYPNPFNPLTKIEFYIPTACHVKLEIFDILGRKVRTLFEGRLGAGVRSVLWDGNDAEGHEVTSGIYFYKLQANHYTQVKKMVLLK